MTVRTRPTLTGMLAIAAAGIFAAGTVGDRANSLFGTDAADSIPVTPARYVMDEAIDAPESNPQAEEPVASTASKTIAETIASARN